METTDNELYSALLDIIKQENSPEAEGARNMMLRRIATAGDIAPSRIPAPQNITEIGGYINLLESIKQDDLRNRMLASTLGVATPADEYCDKCPELFFARRPSDRPDCEQAETLPLMFYIRSDFLESLAGALTLLHNVGASLPIYLTAAPSLPPLTGPMPSQDGILALLGRVLELAPTAAFIHPEQDPLIVAQSDASAIVYARAESIQETTSVKAFLRAATGYANQELSLKLIPIAPLMQAAGWYMKKCDTAQLNTPYNPASALCWRNITGLVAGRTTLGSELSLLYTHAQIAASCLREELSALWDGTKFTL